MLTEGPNPSGHSAAAEQLPAVVVLCANRHERPARMDRLAGRMALRFADTENLGEALEGARALLVWDFFSSALADAWGQCGSLEWVHVAATGVDSLLFDDLRESRVTVTNARGVFDRPIAEFVLASVLAHAKRLHESRRLQAAHVWRHRESTTLVGAKALVVGSGPIGRAIARLLHTVGMEVRGAGRRPALGDPDFGEIVESASLVTHVAWCDYLINAAPLTPATRGLIGAPVFAAMRPSAHLINVGRGSTVVEADLLSALQNRSISGATLDVFDTEPLPPDSPLWDAPGCIISAHMSGDVVGWREALAEQFVENAERWLAGRALVNVVDKRLGYVPGDA